MKNKVINWVNLWFYLERLQYFLLYDITLKIYIFWESNVFFYSFSLKWKERENYSQLRTVRMEIRFLVCKNCCFPFNPCIFKVLCSLLRLVKYKHIVQVSLKCFQSRSLVFQEVNLLKSYPAYRFNDAYSFLTANDFLTLVNFRWTLNSVPPWKFLEFRSWTKKIKTGHYCLR